MLASSFIVLLPNFKIQIFRDEINIIIILSISYNVRILYVCIILFNKEVNELNVFL